MPVDFSQLDTSLIHINGFQFDDWVKKKMSKLDVKSYNPDTLSSYVYLRLKRGRLVSNQTINQVYDLNCRYELNNQDLTLEFIKQDKAKKYLLSIIPFLEDRTLLVSALKGILLNIYELEGEQANHIELYNELVSINEQASNDVNISRISHLNKLGDYYYQVNDMVTASKYYLEVLSFQWITINDVDYFNQFRQQYIHAGSCLLFCRKNNLEELNHTFFIPSTLRELGPIKEGMIKELMKN